MSLRIGLQALWYLVLIVTLTAVPARAKGTLEILRDKGILTEEEYKQAIEEEKKESKLLEWLHRISLFGDVRFRDEGFYHSDIDDNSPNRNRVRIRARLGVGIDVSDELQGKIRLVTGDANDPISTNQTLTDLFTRKPINLDWAYITVSPWKTLGLDRLTGIKKPMLSITVGKYPLPMFVPGGSELLFDGDLSPEGFAESLTVWEQPSGFLRTVKITAVQWSIKEFGNENATNFFNDNDAWMFGGQGLVQLVPLSDFRLTLAIAYYGFQRPDAIARERNSNSALQVTNTVRFVNGSSAGGAPVSPSSCTSPFTAPGCIAGFLGDFSILNVGAQLDVNTPWEQWPLSFYVDFAHNKEAATNDDDGFWLGVRVGRAASQGDFRFTYTYARIETDAVLSVFSYSDFGRNGGTNVMGHFIALDYVVLPRLTLTVKNHFVNFIDRPTGFHNPTQSRLQLDMVLSF